jgi:hypothetical protein
MLTPGTWYSAISDGMSEKLVPSGGTSLAQALPAARQTIASHDHSKRTTAQLVDDHSRQP